MEMRDNYNLSFMMSGEELGMLEVAGNDAIPPHRESFPIPVVYDVVDHIGSPLFAVSNCFGDYSLDYDNYGTSLNGSIFEIVVGDNVDVHPGTLKGIVNCPTPHVL
jgi:hypothetical protein